MLKKSVGFSAAALAFGFMGVLANGCSSTSSTVGPAADSSTDARKDGGGVVDEGGDGSTAPACYAASPLSTTFPWGAPVLHQNLCTAVQIQAYYDSCLADQEAGVDAGGVCNDYVLANVACTTCIIGPLDPTKVPDASADAAQTGYPAPATFDSTASDGNDYTFLNVTGCLAAISTSATDATCTVNATGLNDCAAIECATCAQTDLDTCLNDALNDATACGASYPVTAACNAAITAVSDADATSKCGLSSSGTFEQGVIGIATAFCGP